ncbi:ankyrin repeat domain-containing protein [Paenibacillus koleovorans]|uniref:ankyrin repeat domain-containing protein n=1 Tax=Paenibacillus koleovorans TaxID=121608 RepID=UPI000FDC5F4C|nr:ankyrin repeat domain-containing protein [Paenibacillus koleovorans]
MGQAELFEAVKRKDLETVTRTCAERPELVNMRDAQGNSPILLAAYYGAREVMAYLLEAGALLNVYEACALGKLETVRSIVTLHPELLNSYAHDGFTPLGLAAFFGHQDVALFLILQGADVKTPSYNTMRVQPLHSAAATRQLAVAELLLRHGADANARQHLGWTPLHSAAHNKQAEMVRLLLKYGADPEAPNEAGLTPRAMAEQTGEAALVELLQPKA